MDLIIDDIVMVAPRVENNLIITTRETQFHVDFIFSCDLFIYDYYGDALVGNTVRPRIMIKSVRMDIKQLMNSEVSSRMVYEELREWPLADDDHRDLFEYAMNALKVLVRLMPPEHNVLVIPFNVLVVCNRQVDVNNGTVPATDSSVDSLEIKTAALHENKDESCSICLNDFYEGCEVSSMPCFHVFHEDCIKRWLKISHYCPMCRFEMPTS